MKFKKIGSAFNVDMWAATAGKFSFIIGYNGTGYAASYKDREYEGKQSSHFIEGSPFSTYVEAEKACKEAWRKLRIN